MAQPSTREIVIKELLGLAYDPFVSVISETDPALDFEQIYIDPHDSLLESLEHEEHTIVFGGYGAGKTATRLALAYRLRKQPAISQPPLLSVTYEPQISAFDLTHLSTLLERHLAALAEKTATDAIIQFIERLGERPSQVTEPELEALSDLNHRADPLLHRLVRATDVATDVDGAFWRRPGQKKGLVRPFVRPVPPSAQWRRVVGRLQRSLGEPTPSPGPWAATLDAVKTLGFRGLAILVDGIDEGRTEPATIAQVINPLLAQSRVSAPLSIWFKAFVPDDLDQKYDRLALTPPHDLTTLFATVRIPRIRDVELRQIIHQRFLAASARPSSCRSLDELAEPNTGFTVESRLVALANGSPRVLLRLVDAFLRYYSNAYVEAIARRQRPRVSAADWDLYLHSVRLDRLDVP